MLSGAHGDLPGRLPAQRVLDVRRGAAARDQGQLLALRRAGKLDRVKMLMLTNCTFDGMVYDVERVMEECLAIKPDLVFLWDEAWFAFARFHPIYRPRTAMQSARALLERLRDPAYRQRISRPEPSGCTAPSGRRQLLRPAADPGPGAGPGAGLRHAVDAQDADLAAAGLDDPRLRPGLRAEGARRTSTRPTWRTPRRRRTTRSSPRSTSAAGRPPSRASSWCRSRSSTRCGCATRSTTTRCCASTCAA